MTVPPRDPDRTVLPEDQRLRATVANELPPRPSRFDDSTDAPLQADPEMAEGPAGPGRIIVYAIAAILIVGGVFYGLTRPSTNTASNPPPAATAANTPNTPPPAVRDVTPGPNGQPGVTTGAASNTPAMAPNPANSVPANPTAANPGSASH